MSFSCCLKIDRDPAFRIGVGRSFHQPGMVKENVLESDFEPLPFSGGAAEFSRL